jgi:hypothetical protein
MQTFLNPNHDYIQEYFKDYRWTPLVIVIYSASISFILNKKVTFHQKEDCFLLFAP